jgi:SHS2 domain-containing protein
LSGHETFDHTADIGIRAWGSEFSQVFEEAAKALFEVMAEPHHITPSEKLQIHLSADDGEELFLKWLKELLFIFETRRLLLFEFKIMSLNPTTLSAEVSGEVLNNAKHSLGREVKAVTLHQFKLVKDKGRYLAEVILDI